MYKPGLFLLGMLLFSPIHAQVYEWIDEDGNRHFSDQKPVGVEFRALDDPDATLSSYRPATPRQPVPLNRRNVDANPSPGRNPRSAGVAARQLEKRCADYLARIDSIHDRLRRGYEEPTGNRLRAQRSALRTAYRRDCN